MVYIYLKIRGKVYLYVSNSIQWKNRQTDITDMLQTNPLVVRTTNTQHRIDKWTKKDEDKQKCPLYVSVCLLGVA